MVLIERHLVAEEITHRAFNFHKTSEKKQEEVLSTQVNFS